MQVLEIFYIFKNEGYVIKTMCVLPMQELKFHGKDSLCGLSGSLSVTGKSGKHPQNTKRDMIRVLRKRQLNTDASRHDHIEYYSNLLALVTCFFFHDQM